MEKMPAAAAAEAPAKTAKKTPAQKLELKAPVAGKVLPMTEAKDENFANLILGDGVVICPTADVIVAPCNGVITHCSEDNKHAIGLRSDSGQEVLIHVGVDTVGLNGEGFEQVKAEGDKIKLGEPSSASPGSSSSRKSSVRTSWSSSLRTRTRWWRNTSPASRRKPARPQLRKSDKY